MIDTVITSARSLISKQAEHCVADVHVKFARQSIGDKPVRRNADKPVLSVAILGRQCMLLPVQILQRTSGSCHSQSQYLH